MTLFKPSEDRNAVSDVEQQVDELIDELRRQWSLGSHFLSEDVLANHRSLFEKPDQAVRLVYEEFCLREEAGEAVTEDEYLYRFPQWKQELHVLLQCHDLVQPTGAKTCWPVEGESIGPLQIIRELGRGALGRVYLASENQLGCRTLVVKVAPRDMREPQLLSRLQHTNIAPIYFVHDDPDRHVTAFCMPYLGGTTLDQIFKAIGEKPVHQRTGRDIVSALDKSQRLAQDPLMAVGPVRNLMEQMSYTRALVWIAACMADALSHVHTRGLVHLDIKPSNVLIAADGQPMLLDFHLAREPIPQGCDSLDRLGGTWDYMSREQRAALLAVQSGSTIDQSVDHRADVFGLGAVLYEGLSGKRPSSGFELADLRRLNSDVSDGLADIVARCLAHEASNRYEDLESLAVDLRSHLADLPLRGVRNRNVWERVRKWRRRHPQTVLIGALGAALLFAAAGSVTLLWSNHQRGIDRAQQVLERANKQLGFPNRENSLSSLQESLASLEGLPGNESLKQKLRKAILDAQQWQNIQRLQQVTDQLRFRDGLDAFQAETPSTLIESMASLWRNREAMLQTATESSDKIRLDLIRADLSELAASLAQTKEDADKILVEAESLLGKTLLIAIAEKNLELKKISGTIAQSSTIIELPKPVTAWEHVIAGRALLQGHKLDMAQQSFEKAVQLQPQLFWPHHYLSVVLFRQSRWAQAAHEVDICIALSPKSPECYYNRALCLERLGKPLEGIQDDSQALALSPEFAQAAIHRARLYSKTGQDNLALQDLNFAKQHHGPENQIDYERALIHIARDELQPAWTLLHQMVSRSPDDPQADRLMTLLEEKEAIDR